MGEQVTPGRYLVKDEANSECGSAPLSELDFSNWFVDGVGTSYKDMEQGLYLHIKHKDTIHWTVHRVFCRHSDAPRLQMKDGELYWLVD